MQMAGESPAIFLLFIPLGGSLFYAEQAIPSGAEIMTLSRHPSLGSMLLK
jgi:hypothetical protein